MNNEIIKFEDYRDVLRYLTKVKGTSFRAIAEKTQIHSSYISRVMGGKCEFSEEQIHKIGEAFSFNEWQMQYFLLLGSLGRNTNLYFRKTILKHIRKIRKEKSKLLEKLEGVRRADNTLDHSVYYENVLTAKVHMYLTIPAYRTDLGALAQKLNITSEILEQELHKLDQIGVIQKLEDGIKVLIDSLHLSEDHPFSNQNHKNWRIETLSNLSRGSQDGDYHMSAIFTCDKASKEKIVDTMREAIAKVQKIVADSKNSDEAFHLGLDIY